MAAKISLALAILAMLGAAGVAVLTRGNIGAMKSSLTDAKTSLVGAQKNLSDAKSQLKKAQEDATAATATAEEQKALTGKLKSDAEEATKKFADANTQLESKTKDYDDLKDKLAKMTNTPTGLAPDEVAEKMKEYTDKLQRAEAELAESRQVQQTLTDRMKDNDDKLHTATSEVERYRKNVARGGLSGRILAVNPGWNFVVLSVGDKQGAAVGANLIVLRGGEAIAKAKISSVEPSTSIADVVPGSLRKGLSVQPGDTVVYEGERK